MKKKLGKAGQMALGGTLAALAVCIMTLGALIPAATFCCPAFASVLLLPVLHDCGKRIAWAWYLAVAVLSCLLSPDPEAAAIFVFLGYYPIVRRELHRIRGKTLRIICKLAYFDLSVSAAYLILLYVVGLEALLAEVKAAGVWLTVATFCMGNLTFFLYDAALARLAFLYRRRRYG